MSSAAGVIRAAGSTLLGKPLLRRERRFAFPADRDDVYVQAGSSSPTSSLGSPVFRPIARGRESPNRLDPPGRQAGRRGHRASLFSEPRWLGDHHPRGCEGGVGCASDDPSCPAPGRTSRLIPGAGRPTVETGRHLFFWLRRSLWRAGDCSPRRRSRRACAGSRTRELCGAATVAVPRAGHGRVVRHWRGAAAAAALGWRSG